jgi:SEC-C motif-containing protein
MSIAVPSSNARCPCLSGETYGNCCLPYHRREAAAPTAERLMRSRYSAFAVGDADYLLASWHPSTRPASVDLDPDVRWVRLDILSRTGGGVLDTEGTVEFRAFHRVDGVRGERYENSEFVREGGRWYYLRAK